MGLLSLFQNLAKGIKGGPDQATTNTSTPDPSPATPMPSQPSSCLSPGRMRQTDQVMGPNSPLPHSPGVYRHVSKETKQVEYVGQTNDLKVRQQQHVRSGKLDITKQYVQYAAAKEGACRDDWCRTEVRHIATHHPTGNTTKGGNGRR